MNLIFTLSLREGKFDGSYTGKDLLWDVFSEYDKAVETLKGLWSEDLKHVGKEAKLWLVECYEVDVKDGHRDTYFFSIDGHQLDSPPLGVKFVPPVVEPGRCKYVYFCGMKSLEDIDQAQCILEGYHKEHKAKNGCEFDHHCHEHLSHFPHIWHFYHSQDPLVKANAEAELKKLGVDRDGGGDHQGEAS